MRSNGCLELASHGPTTQTRHAVPADCPLTVLSPSRTLYIILLPPFVELFVRECQALDPCALLVIFVSKLVVVVWLSGVSDHLESKDRPDHLCLPCNVHARVLPLHVSLLFFYLLPSPSIFRCLDELAHSAL